MQTTWTSIKCWNGKLIRSCIEVLTDIGCRWELLEAAGLRPFFTEPNLVYVNINTPTVPDIAEVRQDLL